MGWRKGRKRHLAEVMWGLWLMAALFVRAVVDLGAVVSILFLGIGSIVVLGLSQRFLGGREVRIRKRN